MGERVLMIGDGFTTEEQRIAEAVGVEVVTEEQADALRQLAAAPKITRLPATRAEVFVEKQQQRLAARRAEHDARIAAASAALHASDAEKISAANTKRERRRHRNARLANPNLASGSGAQG